MDFFFNTLKKFLTATVFVAFAFVFTYMPQDYGQHQTVPEAEAFIGGVVIDPSNLAQNTVNALNSISLYTKEFILDNIAWVIAKQVVANIVADTVDWIGSGFEGSPAFVQDLDRFLLNVADQVAGSYFETLLGENSFLCSPFRLDVRIALELEYVQARELIPYQGCLISEVFENFDDFVAGDFFQGGLDDFILITSQPEVYSEYGAYLTAQENLQTRLLAAKEEETNVLSFGQGFLSNEVCEDVSGPSGNIRQDCKIVMPGQTIANRLSDTLGLGEQSLITADELNEIVGALISTLATKAVTGTFGLLGLSPNNQYTDIGYDGGSFTSAVRGESGGSQESLATAGNNLDALLVVQQDYRALASSYRSQANAVLSRTSDSELRSNAQDVVSETTEVINQTTGDIPEIQSIISRFDALTAEYNDSSTSPDRKNDILSEQTRIIQSSLQSGYYSRSSVNASEVLWELALNPPEDDN